MRSVTLWEQITGRRPGTGLRRADEPGADGNPTRASSPGIPYGTRTRRTQRERLVGLTIFLTGLVEPSGIEPLTSCLRSRRSTNMNYDPSVGCPGRGCPRGRTLPCGRRADDQGPWYAREDLNLQPAAHKAAALTIAPRALVEQKGIEPSTCWMPSSRSTN